jgi:hypothetical protein
MSDNNLTGNNQLKRLKTFVDVVFAITFWKILDYLPHFEDMSWVDKPFGLLSNFIEHPDDSLRMAIGLALVIIYWIQNNRLLNILNATDIKHTVINIIQLIFVCLFVYFVIADPYLKGRTSTMAMQSASLALAGFIGLLGLKYAAHKGLVDPQQPPGIINRTYRSTLPEPITATINIALAFTHPIIWTLAWIIAPIILRKLIARNRTRN